MTTSGGMGPACQDMNKRLAQKIADKRGDKYCHQLINHVRTCLRFALSRWVLIALTGERGRPKKDITDLCDIDSDGTLIPKIRSYE